MLAACVVVPLALLPVGANPFGPTKAAVLLGSGALAAAGLGLAPGALRRLRGLAPGAAPALIALLVLTALSAVASVDRVRSMLGAYPEHRGVLPMFAAACVALVAASLPQDRVRRALGRALAVAVALVGAYALAQRAGLDPWALRAGLDLTRVRATLGNASNLGVWLLLAMPLAATTLRAEDRRWRYAGMFAIAVGAASLVLTGSRGAWLGAVASVAAGLIALSLAGSVPRDRTFWLKAVAVVAALLVLAAVAVPNLGDRLGGLLRPAEGTAGWRLEVWGSAARAAMDRPLLGWGPATFEIVYPPYATEAAVRASRGAQLLFDPHNLVLNTAATLGAPAALALVALLAAVGMGLVKRARAGDADAVPLAAALVGGVVALQFHAVTLDTAPLLFVVVALSTIGAPQRPRGRHQSEVVSIRRVQHAPGARALAFGAATLLGLAALAALGVVAADATLAEARTRAGEGPSTIAATMDRARALAPWEAAFPIAEAQLMRESANRAATGQRPQGVRIGNSAPLLAGLAAQARAEELAPLDPRVQTIAGDLHLLAGLADNDAASLDRALAAYERALEIDPLGPMPTLGRGVALLALDRANDAQLVLTRATELAPWLPEAWSNLALAAERTGDTALRQRALQRAQEAEREAAGQR